MTSWIQDEEGVPSRLTLDPSPSISEIEKERAIVTHEVPRRSGPLMQDMGLRWTGYTITGFLYGENEAKVDADKNQLLVFADLDQITASHPAGRFSITVEGKFGVTASGTEGAIIRRLRIQYQGGYLKPRYRYIIEILHCVQS